MRKIQVAVIGASMPTGEQYKIAEAIGKAIADEGWVLINGGLLGVMEASAKGASKAGGLVIGILPTHDRRDANSYVSIPIVTNMGHARNVIIVQSADACIAIGGGEGTLSEIAIALKENKLVVGLDTWNIPGVVNATSPAEVISLVKKEVGKLI